MSNNVHKDDFNVVNLPEQAFFEDRGFKFCSEPITALADVNDPIQWKNDVWGVSGLFDALTVELERPDGTTETALGVQITMPKQDDAIGFVIDWRSNLIAYGAGCYKVKVNWDIKGLTGFYYDASFDLLPYSVTASEGTVQIIVNYDDKILQDGINYTGSGFYTGLRFKGFFGNEQINSEHRNLLKANNLRVKVRNFSAPSYDLVTRPLTRCFTRPLKRMLLNASDIWVSDYNAWNHEQYRYFNVILSDSEGIEFEGDETFVRQINATLLDKLWTTESKYDLKEAQPPALSEFIAQGVVIPKLLTLAIIIRDDEDNFSFNIVANSDGTITSVDNGGLTNLAIEVNGNPVSVPFTLDVGDLVTATFDLTTSDTIVKFIGNYN